MDGQSVLLDQFPYHIVEFVAAGRKPKVRKTDIVATKWLQYDKQKKRVVTRYPPPPYDKEKSNELGSALEELSDAPSTWSTYTVVLRGKAVSLSEAYRKHELLTHQKTTLTAESGESDTEAEKRAANLIRQEQFQSAAKSFNDSLRKKGTKRASESDDSTVVQESIPGTSIPCNNISGDGENDGSPPTKKSSQKSNLVVKPLGDLTNTSEHVANKKLLNAVLACMTTISTDISSLSNDVRAMKVDISKIKAALKDTKINKTKSMDFIATVPQLCQKYNYHIPFKTMVEFQTFNIHLSEKSDLKESVAIVLQSGLDPQMVISKSIVSMLKMFLSKDVATQCVAVRKLEDKVPIKDTPFVHCMTVVIKEHRMMANLETPDKDITSSLSTVLSNACQWYVPRKSSSENTTKSTSPAQNSKISQKTTAPTALVKVVAVEPTDQEQLYNTNAAFTPMQFEFQNVQEDEIEIDEEFDEDYLSKLNLEL